MSFCPSHNVCDFVCKYIKIYAYVCVVARDLYGIIPFNMCTQNLTQSEMRHWNNRFSS